MTRDTTLILVLMLSSIAAAVAAPDLDADLRTATCVTAGASDRSHVPVAELPASRRLPARSVSSPCTEDASAPYRLWHYGSARIVAGCGSDQAEST